MTAEKSTTCLSNTTKNATDVAELLPTLYSVTGDIKDINTLLVSRSTYRTLEPMWCGCGDGIVADSGAKCGTCAYVDLLFCEADAARFAWYFSDKPKGDFLMTYLDGMRTGWTIDQWRAVIDAAIEAESP